ncbi:MAG: hypothetical protein QGI70_17420, partial [Paracoccaceae bacterium]|nr:hypothetical protein [Paracoccaceae bacterium]
LWNSPPWPSSCCLAEADPKKGINFMDEICILKLACKCIGQDQTVFMSALPPILLQNSILSGFSMSAYSNSGRFVSRFG